MPKIAAISNSMNKYKKITTREQQQNAADLIAK